MFSNAQHADDIAYKYADAIVYVWKGFKKGSVGRVLSIGRDYAILCIGGTGVHTLKRENIIRYVNMNKYLKEEKTK